tara:strand:- start:6350 stop:6706 length:357 start_codon:yes stop_codon:yes gene_type:complete
MNDNKLIAEFMGRTTTYDIWDNDSDRGEVLLTKGLDASCVEDEIAHYEDRYGSANIEAVETPLDYKCWTELMPVVETCYHNGAEEQEIGDITHALLDCDMKNLYEAVVEFIKEFNLRS